MHTWRPAGFAPTSSFTFSPFLKRMNVGIWISNIATNRHQHLVILREIPEWWERRDRVIALPSPSLIVIASARSTFPRRDGSQDTKWRKTLTALTPTSRLMSSAASTSTL